MNVKWVAVYFVVVSFVLAVGYFLLMYGGDLSEKSGKDNIPMLLGEFLMWPWIVTVFIKKHIFQSSPNVDLFYFWVINYAGYFLLAYAAVIVRIFFRGKSNNLS